MKKIRTLYFVLIFALLLQCMPFSALASETTESTEETAAVPTEEETIPITDLPTVEFGSASITNGCRTINGMTPMAGTDRILKSAQAAFVYEVNTQTVIYSYNPDVRLYPGSLAKILTALIAIEQGNLDDVVTFSTRWNSSLPAQSIVANLKEGEEVTLEILVYWMMLESANDAALNIAGHIAGSQEAFVEMMNQRAAEIGCTDSHFTNAHGLDDPEQYTTARDVVKIVLAASQNETFMKIFGASSYEVPPTNREEEAREITSDNHLIYQKILPKFNRSEVTGGKTSSTAGAGTSLVCTAEAKDMSLVCLVMGTQREAANGSVSYYGNFEEMFDLLDLAFDRFKIARVLYPDLALNQFPVLGGESDVIGHPDVVINSVVPVDCQMKNLIFRYTVEGGGLTAPIAEGQKIATVQVWYRTSCITEAELFAMNPVRSTVNSGVSIQSAARDDSGVTGILTFLGIAFLVVVIPAGIYLGWNAYRRSMAMKRRRRRQASRRRSR